MRSSKNPYFILCKSKNPVVQDWLETAKSMSPEQINALQIKPDIKKAMIYVCQQIADTQSLDIANKLADLMQCNPVVREVKIYNIWIYQGSSDWFTTKNSTSVNIENGDPWLEDDENNMLFASGSWGHKAANIRLFNHSQFQKTGSMSEYIDLKNHITRNRHPNLQVANIFPRINNV